MAKYSQLKLKNKTKSHYVKTEHQIELKRLTESSFVFIHIQG